MPGNRCIATVTSALATLLSLGVASAAAASSVAYIDGHNLWLSSPDGAHKLQVTTGGTDHAPWQWPAAGRDGKTVVVHRDIVDGKPRAVLHLYGPDAKLVKKSVMPSYSGASQSTHPIGLDMDWDSRNVAFGYSRCGATCETLVQGYWLMLSDSPGAFPDDPQGQSDAFNPTFYGRRVISTDSAGRVYIQPVTDAPFTPVSEGWAVLPGTRVSRVDVSPVGSTMSIEWSDEADGSGIKLGRHQGTIPSEVTNLCDLPTAGDPANLTFSPDGTMIAWADAEGVKVAPTPALPAAGRTCALSGAPKLISQTGRLPHFGGADVAAILRPPTPAPPQTPGGGTPAPQPTPSTTRLRLTARLTGKTTTVLFARGRLKVQVGAPVAGRVTATATVSARVARRLKLGRKRPGVVARGRKTARRAGRLVVTLRPTAAARRTAKRMRGVKLTVKVTQKARAKTLRVRLR